MRDWAWWTDMGRFDKNEPKLNEVKAVLQRLQGFPEDEKPAQQPPGETRSRGGSAVVVISLVLIAAVGGGAYLITTTLTPPAPPSAPAPPKVVVESAAPPLKSEAVKAALETARALMAKGQVRTAREQLLVLARKGSPDAAWDLARSYDPNVLKTLPGPDAAPDIAEATRWYHAWHEAAVKEGMVARGVSIERIIGAMQSSGQP
jgi:hypothetical protein